MLKVTKCLGHPSRLGSVFSADPSQLLLFMSPLGGIIIRIKKSSPGIKYGPFAKCYNGLLGKSEDLMCMDERYVSMTEVRFAPLFKARLRGPPVMLSGGDGLVLS